MAHGILHRGLGALQGVVRNTPWSGVLDTITEKGPQFGRDVLAGAVSPRQWGETYGGILKRAMDPVRAAGDVMDWTVAGDVNEARKLFTEAAQLEEQGDTTGATELRQVAGMILAAVAVPGPQGKAIRRGMLKPKTTAADTNIPELAPSGPPGPVSPVWTDYPKAGSYEVLPKTSGVGTFRKKVHTDEEKLVKKQLAVINKDIDAGNYEPYFDPSKRFDVDPSKYPETSGPQTVDVTVPKIRKSIEKYESILTDPAIRSRLEAGFDLGEGIDNAADFYLLGQLEKEFVSELGAKAGRRAFLEKIIKPLSATTSGATPLANLRLATYANYLRANKLPYPGEGRAYTMPHPIGGRRPTGAMTEHSKLRPGAYFDPVKNPKKHDFGLAFLGRRDVSVNDEQIISLATQGRLLAPAGPEYGYYTGAIDNVLNAGRGTDRRNLQEVIWAGAKKAKEGKNYKGSTSMIEEFNHMIERTRRMTGLSPKEIVRQGFIYSKIPLFGMAAAVGGAAAVGMLDGEQNQGQMVY